MRRLTDCCVAVPPHKPVITWRGNKVTAGAGVGPYHVGDTLVVTCEVSGGGTFLKIIIFSVCGRNETKNVKIIIGL